MYLGPPNYDKCSCISVSDCQGCFTYIIQDPCSLTQRLGALESLATSINVIFLSSMFFAMFSRKTENLEKLPAYFHQSITVTEKGYLNQPRFFLLQNRVSSQSQWRYSISALPLRTRWQENNGFYASQAFDGKHSWVPIIHLFSLGQQKG